MSRYPFVLIPLVFVTACGEPSGTGYAPIDTSKDVGVLFPDLVDSAEPEPDSASDTNPDTDPQVPAAHPELASNLLHRLLHDRRPVPIVDGLQARGRQPRERLARRR